MHFPPQPPLASTVPASLVYLTLFTVLYVSLSSYCSSSKQKSYILSTVSSGVMTILSLVALKEWAQGMGWLARYGMDPIDGMAFGGDREEILGGALMAMRRVLELQDVARAATTFFRSYLVADLLVGSIFYKGNIGLLTGWIHHTVYIILTAYIHTAGLTPLFLLTCMLELPTWHLGLSSLRPKLFRHDLTFLILFGLTRIMFHGYVLWTFAAPSHTPGWLGAVGLAGVPLGGVREGLIEIDGSWVPAGLMAAALPLHVMWFRAGVEGYVRRWRARTLGGPKMSGASSTVVQPKETSVVREATVDESTVQDWHVKNERTTSSQHRIEGQSQAPELQSDASEPSTPEEGVITPYTPYGIPGNNALSSYFLPRKRVASGGSPDLTHQFRELLPSLPTFNIPIPDGLHFELPERLQGMHLPSAEEIKGKREELKNQVSIAFNAWRGRRESDDLDAVR